MQGVAFINFFFSVGQRPEGLEITAFTCFTGKYIYIKSTLPSVKGNVAELKSPLLPPAGETGYCVRFWYHMFGATVGSLRMLLQTVDPFEKTLVKQTWI